MVWEQTQPLSFCSGLFPGSIWFSATPPFCLIPEGSKGSSSWFFIVMKYTEHKMYHLPIFKWKVVTLRTFTLLWSHHHHLSHNSRLCAHETWQPTAFSLLSSWHSPFSVLFLLKWRFVNLIDRFTYNLARLPVKKLSIYLVLVRDLGQTRVKVRDLGVYISSVCWVLALGIYLYFPLCSPQCHVPVPILFNP